MLYNIEVMSKLGFARLALLTSFLSSLAHGDACVAEWGKCGGTDYSGSTTCCGDLVCDIQSEWYSQCVTAESTQAPAPVTSPTSPPVTNPVVSPTSPPATSPPVANPVVSPTSPPVSNPTSPTNCADSYAQCGGIGWQGSTCCEAGFTCAANSEHYSNCQLSSNPAVSPTVKPTNAVVSPTSMPVAPVASPTSNPVTPVADPTHMPVANPTPQPTPNPTPSPTPQPTPDPTVPVNLTPSPTSGAANAADIQRVQDALEQAQSDGVFKYETPTGQWANSDLYKWEDMIKGVVKMAETGIGALKLWIGTGEAANNDLQMKYGIVNIAAFLAQSMQESIRYNACDENNWSDKFVVADHGGSTYSATSACGQLHQSYQDYKCSAEEDALAGGQMACDVDPDMEMRAFTNAQWYGAPGPLFCAPKSKVPKAPRWDPAAAWCSQPGGWQYVEKFPTKMDAATFGQFLDYVVQGGECKEYEGQQAGKWVYEGEGCVNGACPGSDAPLFGVPNGRTDVEGCCWWGRGAIQSTGTCNYGKLSFYLGAKGNKLGRNVLYPTLDFCKNPNLICDPTSPSELKWVAGFFYWLNAVQPYSKEGWNYLEELKKWVDNGMNMNDHSFIDGASGIVNRGCHNPPHCGSGELHAAGARQQNFKAVLEAVGLVA